MVSATFTESDKLESCFQPTAGSLIQVFLSSLMHHTASIVAAGLHAATPLTTASPNLAASPGLVGEGGGIVGERCSLPEPFLFFVSGEAADEIFIGVVLPEAAPFECIFWGGI